MSPLAPSAIPTPHLGAANYASDFGAWLNRIDAVAADSQLISFTIQGTSGAQVALLGMNVRVVKREQPMRGTYLSSHCGGLMVYREVNADLDATPVHLNTLFNPLNAIDAPKYEVRPIRFPYSVSISDAEAFLVDASTHKGDCVWEIDIYWASQGKKGVYTISQVDQAALRVTSSSRKAGDYSA